MHGKIIAVTAILLVVTSCHRPANYIMISDSPGELENLAAKEIRRYIYLRTDELLTIKVNDNVEQNAILLLLDTTLSDQEFTIKTNKSILTITGGSEQGLLYGAYEFIEQMGIRFYLDGDVIPDKKISFDLPELNIREKPVFNLRGILPFHDFPEGPDWWNEQEYKSIIGQLVKMKMNFIGFHTYPYTNFAGGPKSEPFVWIGRENEINPDGTISKAYPALHFTTNDSTWGYNPVKTSDFHLGGSQLFETDNFGADYMKNISGWPHTDEENIRIFNECGKLINKAFLFAGKLGVITCTGTETPLIIPPQIKLGSGIKTISESEVKDLYRGIFTRIAKTYPLDYFWLWTPENWTWNGASDAEVANTERDMQLANEALDEIGNPFQLATCGWVLGPPKDRAQFDKILPGNIPFSCINRGVGYVPVEKGFQNIKDRPAWSIPWMEDDPTLLTTQLWVGRTLRDAYDSWKYGCDGLIGIHWRTRNLGPTVSALAIAAWNIDKTGAPVPGSERDIPATDFYMDFVNTQFGIEDKFLTDIFISMDSKGSLDMFGNKGDSPLNASNWNQGPGGLLMIESRMINEHLNHYDFIPLMESFRSKISGKGNLERFDYWLNSFKMNKVSLETALLQKELDSLILEIKKVSPIAVQKEMAVLAIPLRIKLAGKWTEMTNILLSKITTTGEMGTLANLEMHNIGKLQYLSGYDSFLRDLGVVLPENCFPSKNYQGSTRIILSSNQSILENGESFYLRARVLSKFSGVSVNLYRKNFEEKSFKKAGFKIMDRNVFEISIPASEITSDFEYYIEAETENEKVLYPATANEINNTVVLINSNLTRK